ncbi:MAG: carbohydrate ABC transporter permease, partial [Anaerolineae bacterium]|nr:carbohydrate ABC transporter permease [Anaerolineae bacterium]
MSVRTARSVRLARAVLLVAMLLVATPLIFQIGISFKPPEQVFTNVLSPFTTTPTLENYAVVLRSVPIVQYLWNSLAFSAGVTIGQ